MNGSGRGVVSKKLLVQEVCGLDIVILQRRGVFESGPDMRWTSSWKMGDEVFGGMAYELIENFDGPAGLRLLYHLKHRSDDSEKFDYPVWIESSPCNYGGFRWWFICPLQAGQNCVHRCRVIYITPHNDHFGCRECSALTYECRQKHRDFYYEYLHKPQARLEIAKKNLRSRSPKKMGLALQEIALMRRRFEEFERLSAIRSKKFMEQTKCQ